MASKPTVDAQIDRLVLDISVQDGKGRESAEKKISALDKALSQFQTTVKGLDLTGFKSKFASMASALKPFVDKLKEAQKSIRSLNELSRRMGVSGKDATGTPSVGKENVKVPASGGGTMPKARKGDAQQLDGVGELANSVFNRKIPIEELTKDYGKLKKQITDASGLTTFFFEDYEKNNKITRQFTGELDDQGNVIASTFKQVNKTSNNVSGDGLKAFYLSIKRIALYRAIRTSLRIIVKMFREGIANVAKFDETTSHAMNEIHSSFVVIKNSIGLVFKPLIELVAPFIRMVAKAIGGISNAIGYLTAKLRGQAKVLQVNTEYFEEMNKQSHLLDFDQFSVLSNMDQTSGMFEWVQTSELDKYYTSAEGIANLLQDIIKLIGVLAGLKLVKLFISGGFKSLFSAITNPITLIIAGVATLVYGITELIKNWENLSGAAKVLIPILMTVLGVIAGIAVAKYAAAHGFAAPIAAGIAAGALVAGITAVGGIALDKKIAKYADGGMFEGAGTMYHLAGESGAEIVASGSRGTGVTNIEQFKVAMVEALAEYGVAQKDGSGAPIIIRLDGREIARAQVRNNANELSRNYNIEFRPR